MKTFLAVVAGATLALVAGGASAQTLKAVKDRGTLNCGVSRGLPGFSAPDAKGVWSGFDVDYCRAIAAAVLDDPNKVKFVPLSADDRFPALQKGEIDVLSRNSTWTVEREAKLGLLFTGINYYDGQGFLVPTARNLTSALELDLKDGAKDVAKVCVQSGTTAVGYTEDFFKTNMMKLELVTLPTSDDMVKAYEDGRCNTLTTDVSQLYALRLLMKKPADHIVVPDVISKEPLGPVVRQGDDQWFNIVKWVHFGLVDAEELGVTRANVDAALKSDKPDVRRLVGADGDFGVQLGLTKDVIARVVKAVGNYGEIYERNVGTGSQLAIPRGLNQLWRDGGIQYAPPYR